jgi:HAD superfamily hydrolase (TIGR01509 family)
MTAGSPTRLFSHTAALVFDFDGTLVDAHEAICFAFARVVDSNGGAALDPEWLRPRIGRPLRDLFVDALGPLEDDRVVALTEEYRGHFMPMAKKHARLLPGTAEVVRHFAGRIPLAIATSRTAAGARELLDAFGLKDGFAAVIGIEDVTRPKPDPEPLLKAIGVLGISPELAVMVGDTPDDVMAGQRAGFNTVAVTSGAHDRVALEAHGPDAVIDRLDELIGLIDATRSS